MRADPSRRELMAGIGAVAASAALPVRAVAAEASSGQAYRTAGELLKALAGRKVSSRELVDAAIDRIEALDGKINAVVVRDSTGRAPPPMPPTWLWPRASAGRCSACR